MRIDFQSEGKPKNISLAKGVIDTLTFKNETYYMSVGNYVVEISTPEMKRLSTIYGYTSMNKTEGTA